MERTRWLVRSRQWEITRQQGWFGYVVLRKAIPLGLSGLLGEAIASRLFHHSLHEFLWAAIVMFAVMTALGSAHWMVNERRYHPSSSFPQDTPQ
jgi:hypothetical protein